MREHAITLEVLLVGCGDSGPAGTGRCADFLQCLADV